MTLEIIRSFFAWCSVINLGLLIIWFIFFVLAGNFAFKIHNKLFKISEEKFHTINYAAMAFYKMAIFLFNLIPYFALRIIA